MPDELHGKRGRAIGVPGALKWENGQQQVNVSDHQVRASGPRSLNLRGNVLHNLWIPLRSRIASHVFLHHVGKAPIEAREIDANDDIWLSLDRQRQECLHPAAKLKNAPE